MSKQKQSDFPDILLPSSKDTVCLLRAMNERYDSLFEAYFKIRGKQLKPPKSLEPDIIRCVVMKERFKIGDFRNTRSEMLSLRAVADWTHKTNCNLRNQEYKPIQWSS